MIDPRYDFNEAPADHGGKPHGGQGPRALGGTSMRPPLITGENSKPALLRSMPKRDFNEAPADHGGKRHAVP